MRHLNGVLLSRPDSVKSLVLRFIELLHNVGKTSMWQRMRNLVAKPKEGDLVILILTVTI